MNRPLLGWGILWLGLLLTVISGRHASGSLAMRAELDAIHGGVPAQGNGWCSAIGGDCATPCTYKNLTDSCKICEPSVNGGTTKYLTCENLNLGNTKNCVYTNDTANCGALTSTPANNPPFGGPGNPVGPCQDVNGNWICVTATGGEPACSTYLTVDKTNSTPCPP